MVIMELFEMRATANIDMKCHIYAHDLSLLDLVLYLHRGCYEKS